MNLIIIDTKILFQEREVTNLVECVNCGEFIEPIYGDTCPNCGENVFMTEEEFEELSSDEDYYDEFYDDYDDYDDE